MTDIDAFRAALTCEPLTSDPDVALQLIRALEECKNAATSAQAQLTVTLHDAQTAADRARGINAGETARVVGNQLGLARRISPRLGTRFLGVARAMTEMPHTAGALRAGVIGEWQATQLVAETAFLSLADRQVVDEAVRHLLGTTSDRKLAGAARAAAYRADPEAFVARRATAERERRVSLRPAPDCMTLLTALLPVADGVACQAALTGVGPTGPEDGRGKGQRMADALVERITGRPARLAPKVAAVTDPDAQPDPDDRDSTATDTGTRAGTSPGPGTSPGASPVAVNLLVPMESLTGEGEGHLEGFGPIPAEVVREFLADHEAVGGLIRRVFTIPKTGELVAMDSRARAFPGLLAAFVRLRDQVCRTPFCGATIKHIDHIQPVADGGQTCVHNAAGDCERCNYAKEHPDLQVTGNAEEYTVRARGIQATSRAPDPPGRPTSACSIRIHTKRIRLRV
ncbi:HNH endonuclease signature motif containing protein [Branchiibius sp. NY16-3462-2]|uniref:HNH endonuclease n=1 Tax=Branchiibius sp. NY16-3462-2 TaxID=1807500 RepID=UPI0025C30DD1|nr:HNH endonuclease signature motif containing protein [Branchiibius sp. NY16-3462-2]